MKNQKKPVRKVKAPKGAELILESPARLKGKALKASFVETISKSPILQYGNTLGGVINASKVKNASKLGKFKKK
jgi:hypothetical protein